MALEQWEKHKKTILFITHDVEEAVFLSGSVLARNGDADKEPCGNKGAGRLSAYT